jgi:hypothetical protein
MMRMIVNPLRPDGQTPREREADFRSDLRVSRKKRPARIEFAASGVI